MMTMCFKCNQYRETMDVRLLDEIFPNCFPEPYTNGLLCKECVTEFLLEDGIRDEEYLFENRE